MLIQYRVYRPGKTWKQLTDSGCFLLKLGIGKSVGLSEVVQRISGVDQLRKMPISNYKQTVPVFLVYRVSYL